MQYKILLALLAVILILLFSGCNRTNDGDLTTIRVSEVTRSVFYAPKYVAIELGFFADEGIHIDLITSDGADRVMTALLTGAVEIGFSGPEAVIYVWAGGRVDHPVVFSNVTQRDGSFLIAREPMPDFTWDDVRGKTIIGGRVGGMPQMVLEYILYQYGIVPGVDVEILTNLAFTTTAAAFAGGVGDFTAEFDPSAFMLEQAGTGYVVASLGEASGIVPYTVYMATLSFIEQNPDIVQNFTSAIHRAQVWVSENSPEEIARVIQPQFPENTYEELTIMVRRYHEAGVWLVSPVIEQEGFELIQDIMELSGELERRVIFDGFVNNTFAHRAIGR